MRKFSFEISFKTINSEFINYPKLRNAKLRERETKKDPLHRLIQAWKERGGGSWILIPFKSKEETRWADFEERCFKNRKWDCSAIDIYPWIILLLFIISVLFLLELYRWRIQNIWYLNYNGRHVSERSRFVEKHVEEKMFKMQGF